jgi:hypothetical protein
MQRLDRRLQPEELEQVPQRSAVAICRRLATERRLFDIRLRLPAIAPARVFMADRSMAAEFEDQLLEWLPEATSARLVATHDGRDVASINAFCDAADGLSKTVVIAVTENGESICGAFIDPAWREGDWARDTGQQSP